MFALKRVVVLTIRGATADGTCPCTSHLVRTFSVCHLSLSPKRNSPYSSVNTDRYSSVVKSVMSVRISCQTPETLEEEDEHIYGPVIKAKAPSSMPETRAPKIIHPFLMSEAPSETGELDTESPLRIKLNRVEDRSSFPSVTRILQQTLSPEQIFYLDRWKKRMIAELGEDGFKEYSRKLFGQGKLFHKAVEDALQSDTAQKDQPSEDTTEYPSEVKGYMQSISHILEDVSAVRAIESKVHHSSLNYLGIIDCVARYRGVLCVIDWKTSEKPKPYLSNTYDNPVQVAAYAGALNHDDNYKYQVENGLIVVAYKDGSPAHAHKLSADLMVQFWEKWLIRLEEFTQQR